MRAVQDQERVIARRFMDLAFRVLKQPLLTRRERRRWRAAGSADGDPIRVFYGYDRLPSPGDDASGGIIKCQDLQRRFTNDTGTPTILYLVSSALPPRAVLMAGICRESGGKLVLNQNGVAYPGWYGTGWEAANEVMAELHAFADHVLYQSGFCQRSAEKFLGMPSGPSEILYNPVDASVFTPSNEPAPLGAPVLLLAGSHHFRYRMTTAVDTLSLLRVRIPGARLLIAGRYAWQSTESASRQDLREYARSKGVHDAVDMEGAYTQQEAPGLYRRAHILLHTKYNDPCPRVVIEAMASGLPVVYSASGGVPEQVGTVAGVGVPARQDWEQDHPPDPEALSQAVLQILEAYAGFSVAARKRAVERFDADPWLTRHKQVFESLVQE